jgi:cobalt/nickel transport system permease protein
MIGTLFIRSYERGERVYAAMVSRGFEGSVNSLVKLNFKQADAIYGLTCVAALVAVAIFGFIYRELF